MYILYLFEAVFIAHDISLEKKGLECNLVALHQFPHSYHHYYLLPPPYICILIDYFIYDSERSKYILIQFKMNRTASLLKPVNLSN